MSRARQQTQKAEGVGDKPRREQHGATDRKNQPLGHFFCRQLTAVEPFIRPQQGRQPLLAQQPGPDYSRQKHQPYRIQHADNATDLNQYRQFGNGHNDEKKKENGQNASP